MKKLLFIMCCLLIMPSVCNAELLDNFKEMRYRLEAGTNFRDYNTAYQDLYITYKKTNNQKYKSLINMYAGLRELWHDSIFTDNPTYYSYSDFIRDNPKCITFKNADTYIDLAIKCIVNIAPELEKGVE